MTNAIVVGYGSIGARHARLLRELGGDIGVVSARAIDWPRRYATLEDALDRSVDHVVIANETADHWATLLRLRALGFDGKVLLEKPVADHSPTEDDMELCHPARVWVGYNLRFHPAIQALRARIEGRSLVNVSVRAGQDLRLWRSGRAVEATYSAQRARGGGVLRDLSHELDYVGWLFGAWTRLSALGGNLGPLPIDADDCWSILIDAPRCRALSVQLDYYHRPGMRTITANLPDGTVEADLIRHTFKDDEGERTWTIERDSTYRSQLEAFLGRSGDTTLCTLQEGLATLRMIECIERAASSRTWIER